MPNYHVVPSEDGWSVKKAGGQKASAKASTQKEAEKIAKEFCHNSGGGEVRIHRPDGTIRDSDTIAPGNDPCPPKDKKH